ncbi:MAG: hypothetical protein H8E85_08270 [Candidatus Marinimicrobia bacterium]|nr:hypothetical protein [Candidatus Neomarinimicrobiota bacterium]
MPIPIFANSLFVGLFVLLSIINANPLEHAKPKLSDYGFFREPMAEQIPVDNIFPYRISTALFTDYAYKSRFIVLPDGEKISYISSEEFDFPIGTIFIKTFYYPTDFRAPEKDWQIIETRLLVHTSEGWAGYPYVWNQEQTDASLEIAGDRQNISWIDTQGKAQNVNYLVPNFNMCKGCHFVNKTFQPIGPKPRLLNCDNFYNGYHKNQLKEMLELDMVEKMPPIKSIPATAEWDDEHYSLNDRARAYLDVNCAHCHNSKGPASTSGLFLEYHEEDVKKLGVFKPPIAAGRGSGNLDFNIVPGKPNESIFIYRMESSDPGILMPESGRKMVHKEGVALIRDWILSMKE